MFCRFVIALLLVGWAWPFIGPIIVGFIDFCLKLGGGLLLLAVVLIILGWGASGKEEKEG